MLPFKLLLVTILTLSFCSQSSDGTSYHWWKYGLYGGAVAAPVLLPVAVATAPHGVPLCLFLKLLAIKKGLLLATPAVAIGSLVAGTGTGLLVGKLGTLAALKAFHSSHTLHTHKGHPHGWGWTATHKIPLLPFHKWLLEFKHHGHFSPWKWFKHGHGGYSFRFVPNHGWGWGGNVHEPFFRHYKVRYHRPKHHFFKHSHGRPVHFHGPPKHFHGPPPHHHHHGDGHFVSHGPTIHHSHTSVGPIHTEYGPTTYSKGPTTHDDHHGSYSEGTAFETAGPVHTSYTSSSSTDDHSIGGDGLEWSESQNAEKTIKTRSAVAEKEDQDEEPIKPLTDAEYFTGVMKFASAPFSGIMSGLGTMFGLNKDEAKPTGATPTSEKSGQPWEFPGLSARESEQFLEQHFDKLRSKNPEEGMSLVRVLRQAYAQIIHDLGSKSETIPEFIPMPPENETDISQSVLAGLPNLVTPTTTATKPTDEELDAQEEADIEKAIEHIPKEVKIYFTLLSAFDNETCFEKLVCDIHTRVNEEDDTNFTPYEKNVLSVFALLKEMSKDKIQDPVSTKYFNAAKFGEENLSSELCQQIYPQCQYSTNEIMDMGSELAEASEYSIPNYMLNNLEAETAFPSL